MGHQIAIAWDNEGGLAEVAIQPKVSNPEPGRVQVGMDQLRVADGFEFQTWAYSTLLDSEMSTLLIQFGLSAAESAQVTVNTVTRLSRTTFDHYNAVISRPTGKYTPGMWRDVVFDVALIEAL